MIILSPPHHHYGSYRSIGYVIESSGMGPVGRIKLPIDMKKISDTDTPSHRHPFFHAEKESSGERFGTYSYFPPLPVQRV